MEVEFSNDLKEHLSPEKTGLDIAASYITKERLHRNYLNRSFGNAYDFNQIDRIRGVF